MRAFYTESDFTLKNSLLGAFKLTTNIYTDKYSFSEYDVSFDVTFSLPNGGFDKNVILLGA